MPYLEGNLTGTQTGLTVMAAIKTAFDAAPPSGWSFVEAWTESSVTWNVYRCAASSSGLPNDFHVILLDTSAGSNTLYVWMCEGYDTSTHRARRPANGNTGTWTPPAGADGAVGDDTNLYRPGTTAYTRTAGTTGISSVVTASSYTVSSVTTWAAFFYADGVTFSFKATTGGGTVYAGEFQTLVKTPGTNDVMPIGVFPSLYFNSNAFCTRSAMNAGISQVHSIYLTYWHGSPTWWTNASNPTDSTTFDKYAATSGAWGQPLAIHRGATTGASTGGMLRGKLPYVLLTAAGTIAWGDTMTIGSATYQAITAVTGINAWVLKA